MLGLSFIVLNVMKSLRDKQTLGTVHSGDSGFKVIGIVTFAKGFVLVPNICIFTLL